MGAVASVCTKREETSQSIDYEKQLVALGHALDIGALTREEYDIAVARVPRPGEEADSKGDSCSGGPGNLSQKRKGSKGLSHARLPHLWVASLEEPLAAELKKDSRHKIVHLMRHGQADHQLLDSAAGLPGPSSSSSSARPCSFTDTSLVGSRLTEQGREESKAKLACLDLEVVFCSPMMRALETATCAFEVGPQDGSDSEDINADVDADPDGTESFARQVSNTIPPFEAYESIRAQMGPHMHSKRLSITELRKTFPDVDFSPVKQNEDTLWSDQLESREEMDERAAEFVRLMMTRSEKRLAIVTHITFLATLLQPASNTELLGKSSNRVQADPAIFNASRAADSQMLSRQMEPGEVRSFVVVPQDN